MDPSSLSRSRLYFWLFISFVILLSLITGIYALKHPQIFKSKASEDGSVEIIGPVNTTQIQLEIIAPDWSQLQSFKFNLITQVYAQEEEEPPIPDQDVPPEPTSEPDLVETTQIVKISLNPEAIQKDAACLDSFDAQARCLEMPFSELLIRGGRVDWFLPEQEGEYTIYIGFISNKGNFKSTSTSVTLSRQAPQPESPVQQVSEAVNNVVESMTTSDTSSKQTTGLSYSCDCIDFDNICNSACSEYGTVGNYCSQASSCTTKVEPGLPQFASEGNDPQILYRNSGVSLEDYQKILTDLQAIYGDKVVGWVWQDLGDGDRRPTPVYSDTQSFPTGIPSISEDQAREIGIFAIGAATGASKLLLAPGYALVHFLSHPDVGGEKFLTVSELKEMGINIEVAEQTDPETGETEMVIGPDINQILAQANSLGLALQLFPDPDPQTQEVRFVVLPPINPTTLEQVPTLLVDTFLGEVGGRVIGKAIHFTAGKIFKRTAPAAEEVLRKIPDLTPEEKFLITGSPVSKVDPMGEAGFVLNNSGELQRLAQALTIDQRLEMQAILRQKYSLPPQTLKSLDPAEYLRRLKQIAKDNGVDIRTSSEYGTRFFEETPAEAVYQHTYNQIIIDYTSSIASEIERVEHELVHALQFGKYPRMSLEQKEFEAHLAVADTHTLARNPELVDGKIKKSVELDKTLPTSELVHAGQSAYADLLEDYQTVQKYGIQLDGYYSPSELKPQGGLPIKLFHEVSPTDTVSLYTAIDKGDDVVGVSKRADGVINVAVADGVSQTALPGYASRISVNSALRTMEDYPASSLVFVRAFEDIRRSADVRAMAQERWQLIVKNAPEGRRLQQSFKRQMDRYLSRDSDITATTLAVAQYDSKTGILSFAIKGDTRVVIFKRDGTYQQFFDPSNHQLYFQGDFKQKYEILGDIVQKVKLEKDEVVIIASDGVVSGSDTAILDRMNQYFQGWRGNAQARLDYLPTALVRENNQTHGIVDDTSIVAIWHR